MAARKGLKDKINNYLKDNCQKEFTGLEIEQLYIQFGGAVCKTDHGRFGRVAFDTMRTLLSTIQADKVGSTWLKAKYKYNPNKKMTLHEFSKCHPYFYEKIIKNIPWRILSAPGGFVINASALSMFEIADIVKLRFQFNGRHLDVYSNGIYFPRVPNDAWPGGINMSSNDLYKTINDAIGLDFPITFHI